MIQDVPSLRVPQSPDRSASKEDPPLPPYTADYSQEDVDFTADEGFAPTTRSGQSDTAMMLDPGDVKGRWKHMFSFMRWSHTWPLLAAMVATVIAAALKTLLAILLGRTFDVMTNYAAGTSGAEETKNGVTMWCYVLFGVGAANWLANTAFLALWIAFGELQANSARRDIFDTLVWEDMGWFDSQEQGVSSLLVRIQT